MTMTPMITALSQPAQPQAAGAPKGGVTIPDFISQPLTPAEKALRRTMADAWKAYRGQFDPPLKKKNGKDAAPENAISNRCGPIVDKGVAFLFGKPVKVDIPKVGKSQQTATMLSWGDEDDMMTMLSKIAMNGAVCGHAFARILEPAGPGDAPRIVNLDPQIVTVITDDDDSETVLGYIIEYDITVSANDTLTKRLGIWRVDPDGEATQEGGFDKDSRWLMQHFTRQGAQGKLIPIGDTILWPYPFAPIIDCQNLPNPNEFWGLPDLPPEIIKLNETLNFAQSNRNKILKFHAHPKTFLIGVDAAQVQTGIEDMPCLPDGAKVQMEEMHGDLKASADFCAEIRSDMDEQSRVPAVALGRLEVLPRGISGVALEILFMPLMEKTTLKQRLYGRMIREITRRVMAIAGIATYDPHLEVDIHWQNLIPIDDLAAAQTALAMQAGGFASTETLSQELGYDWNTEQQKQAKIDAAKVAATPLALPAPAAIPPATEPQLTPQEGSKG